MHRNNVYVAVKTFVVDDASTQSSCSVLPPKLQLFFLGLPLAIANWSSPFLLQCTLVQLTGNTAAEVVGTREKNGD